MAKVNFSASSSSFANSFPTVNTSVKPNKTSFEMRKVSELKLDPKGEFQRLFPLDEVLIEKLAKSMEQKGYDKSQPIQLIKILSEPETGEVVGDGHNRKCGAEKGKIEEVPVYVHTFATREEAKIYLMEDLQLHRRNLTQIQKIALIEALDKLKNPGRKPSDSEDEKETYTGKSATKTAEEIGVSTSYVENVRNVLNNGDEEIIKDMKAGELSVSAASKKTREKKNPANKDNDDELSDALGTNEGTPAGLIFNHSDGIERPDYKISKEEDLERTNERKISFEEGKKQGFEKGYSDGAYDVYVKIFELLESGMSIEDVKNHNLFSDFSYCIFFKKINEEIEETKE